MTPARIAAAGEALAALWGEAIDMPDGPLRELRMEVLAAWAAVLACEEAAQARRAAFTVVEGGRR